MNRKGWIARGALGGVLMGLANLVPGISGGTMLVAAGIYRRFIDAVSDVTRFRWNRPALATLAVVVGAALCAIVLLAGPIRDLVVEHRWMMYSIFIGLTLGGVPLVARMARPMTKGAWIGVVLGFVAMAALALVQGGGAAAGEQGDGALLFVAGAAGAAAMILPGVSGGYLLLVLGAYVPILTGIDTLKESVKARDFAVALDVGTSVILPVGLGVLVGVAVVSNLLRMLLHRFEKPTLGSLIGLLFGAVVGLWPFQEGVPPRAGDMVKGRILAAEDVAKVAPKDWRTQFFTPSLGQIAGALALIAAGFAVTALIARVSGDEES